MFILSSLFNQCGGIFNFFLGETGSSSKRVKDDNESFAVEGFFFLHFV